ncbi:MAG: formamidopyrimidine-DNA glycosylase [Pirellulales bacterium]|nr:formamidopyrimidine-DNA glycosylase [Pirellulales bacterium]
MPELPEVETMCRGIRPIVGRRALSVQRPKCARRPIAIMPRIDCIRRRIEGKYVSQIERVGKRVVIWFSDAGSEKGPSRTKATSAVVARLPQVEALVIEPRMTGLVLLSSPPTREHLRLRLSFGPKPSPDLWFWDRRGLGTVTLYTAGEFEAKFRGCDSSLGPDALSVSAEQFRERLGRSRRAIKVALLDQKAVAGVGNLYASEILHLASIHPAACCQRLRKHAWQRLHAALIEVLQAAIQYEGSTLSDGTYRTALNQNGGYQNHHRVYDRAGQPCRRCAGQIRRIVQAQRSTFFCPNCQRCAPA